MAILVTGSTGTIGYQVLAHLQGRNVEVSALTRSPETAQLPSGMKAVRGDLTSFGGVQDLGSDMGPSAGFAARQTLANILKNSTQKRSGRCIQHLTTPQGAKEW